MEPSGLSKRVADIRASKNCFLYVVMMDKWS